MCIGIPVEILSVSGIVAEARDGDTPVTLDISLLEGVRPGMWVLNFLGSGREILDPDEARKIRAAVGALQSIMTGGEIGDAFADLEARGPQLPAHLQAAQAAGKTTA